MIVIADDDSKDDDNDSDGKCLSSRQQAISYDAERAQGREVEGGRNMVLTKKST